MAKISDWSQQERDAGEELFRAFLRLDKQERIEIREEWHEENDKILRAELAERRKEPLDNLEDQEIVDLLNELEEEEQEEMAMVTTIKLLMRIAELKEEEKQEPQLQRGAEEQQNKGAWGEVVKFVWLLIFTVGIIFTIVAMIAGWLRILYGVIILFVLFGCVKAMPKGG